MLARKLAGKKVRKGKKVSNKVGGKVSKEVM